MTQALSDAISVHRYWNIVECMQKLIITGILGFIAPGQPGQVVAGLGITFLFLLFYQRQLPYYHKTHRQIGYAAAVELPIFFVFALLLKTDIRVTSDDERFYDVCIGVLMCSVFVLPVLLLARRLRWSVEEEEEAVVARAHTTRRLRRSQTAADHEEPAAQT